MDDGEALIHIENEKIRQAELRCQVEIARQNVQHLSADIIRLSQEVENAQLREKWASSLKRADGQLQSPVEDTLAICSELWKNPELIDGIMLRLNQKQARLQTEISAMLKELNDSPET